MTLENFLSLDCLEFSKNRWKKPGYVEIINMYYVLCTSTVCVHSLNERNYNINNTRPYLCATYRYPCGLHGFEHLAMIMSLNLGNNNDTAGQGKTWHLFMFVLSVWIYTHNFFTFKIRNPLCCEGYEEQYFSWYWNPKTVCKGKGH